jgi:ligand-binding SRPBCC domain-containing protein
VRYHHRFEVDAPLAVVAAFHDRPQSLRALTPPLLPMRLLGELPPELGPGDEMSFRMWLGPLPVTWRARIETLGAGDDGEATAEAADAGFQDRQLAGPFAHWLHRHRFTALGANRTVVDDEIEARLRRHPLWGVIGLKMWLGLPLLFAWRRYRTRRLLAPASR